MSSESSREVPKNLQQPVSNNIIIKVAAPPRLLNIYLSAFSVLLYILSFGFAISYTSPAIEDMLKPGSRFRSLTVDEKSWIVSLPALAAAPATLLAGVVTQKFGRKATLMLTSAVCGGGWLIVAYAPTVPVVYLGRILIGSCFGLGNVAVPAYISEISTVQVRGFIGSGVQTFFCIGMLAVMVFGTAMRWSWLAFSGAGIVAVATILVYFVPESPPWLVRYKRHAEAVAALEFLKGKNYDAEAEVKSIAEKLAEEPKFKLSWTEFKRPTFYKPLLISMAVITFQQFSGMSSVMSYTATLFKATGNLFDPNWQSVIVAAVQLVFTVVGASLLDLAGRKIMFLVSGCGMALCLTVLGFYTFFTRNYGESEATRLGWIPLVLVMICIAVYSVGFGPIPFVLMPELVPLRTRSTVLTIAVVFASLATFVSIKSFYFLIQWFGLHGLYWIYGLCSLLGALFYWFLVPETKGLTADDINKSFSSDLDK